MNPQAPDLNQKNESLDTSLRPLYWNDYIGQKKIKSRLKIFIEASRRRADALDHILLYGPPGLGKTTLARVIAKERNANIKTTSGAVIEKIGDLASILTSLSENDFLFIDEMHRLNKNVEEVLYPAMEQGVLDIMIGKGPSARAIQLDLQPFTLIGATTKAGLISSPLRSRFGITARLDFYEQKEIEEIITRSASILKSKIEQGAVEFIASCSRGAPRTANLLLKRARDYSDIKNNGIISKNSSVEALKALEVDELGLESTDRMLLQALINRFNGGPVGIKTLADSISEERSTIEDVYEPYLMRIGFLDRTPRGRVATPEAYKHLGLSYERTQ